jgi:AraC family transcriptional regulator of adaptative response / DNA-3-methyladenine glycosylase II
VRFYRTAAAAHEAGFRACKRCLPEAAPGSPEWDIRGDTAARAMRLIADGVVDREGVAGLARQLNFSERHLHRQLVAEVGAGPIALARAQRAQTARILIETTDVPISQLAFASGFASIRQFNDTIRTVFAVTPTQLRDRARSATSRRAAATPTTSAGTISLRLPFRAPLDTDPLIDFLAARAVAGSEAVADGTYRRSLDLPFGSAIVALTPTPDHVACTLRLDDLRDLPAAVERCRRLLDLDADPIAVDAFLAADPVLESLVRKHPGLRVPGHVDGFEVLVRAIVGQQVSVAGARTVLGRIVAALGDPLARPDGGIVTRFPSAVALADAPADALPMPGTRAATVRSAAAAAAAGDLVLDPGVDREELRARLLAMPGIGAWTADYVALRALGDPDVFLPGDLGVRRALEALGGPGDARGATERAEAWRPWRSYALTHLWTTLTG